MNTTNQATQAIIEARRGVILVEGIFQMLALTDAETTEAAKLKGIAVICESFIKSHKVV